MTRRALIAGVTGLIGGNLAEHLISKNWDVYGIARKPKSDIRGVRPIAADLLDPEAVGNLLKAHQLKRHDNHKLLFSLVMFEQWLRGIKSNRMQLSSTHALSA